MCPRCAPASLALTFVRWDCSVEDEEPIGNQHLDPGDDAAERGKTNR
jgi:hypothetical protein